MGAVPWYGFHDLLCRPQSRGIFSDVEVKNFPSRMCQDNQHVEELEPDRRHDKEIDRYQVIDVVFQKRLPARRGPSSIALDNCPRLTSPS